MTLTRRAEQLHQQADQLTRLTRDLHSDEKAFVLNHWNASATSQRRTHGAWFTPLGLARDLSIELGDTTNSVVDLCAGIGHLTWECRDLVGRVWNNEDPRRLICIEREEEYVRVGRKVLPEAHWVNASVFAVGADPARYGITDFADVAISNPPYGRADIHGTGPRYTGPRAEFHIIDTASTLARRGVFLIPQTSAAFEYSGRSQFTKRPSSAYERFHQDTGITLTPNCGIDTTHHDSAWEYPAPRTGIVLAELAHTQEHQAEFVLAAASDQ